jgi:ABC-2 type transport system ATP-binding protein
MSDLAVEVLGLQKSFGGVQACHDLTFSVQTGEIVGLVGPDGAGKTTTFRILCGILAADAGQAVVVGSDVAADPEAVKRQIGYLPQRFSLHRDLTVWENIRYMADLYGVAAGQWEARANELLEITYLQPFRQRLAGRLSGGMKQKLALLCALIHRPRLLLLDEPTTGVDPVSRRDFWQILYHLPQQGVTILISTPYMDEAARCNRVAFMYQGRLLALDTPAGLRGLAPGQYLEVRCQHQRRARERLQAIPEVSGVEVFGDRLHVALAPGGRAEIVAEALAGGDFACEHIAPVEASLEDVFMELTRRLWAAGSPL